MVQELPNLGRGDEGLKHMAEAAVSLLGATGRLGQSCCELAGIRTEDDRLNQELAGIAFEGVVMVGAGWDKTAKCVDGLYDLGFAGTEVGTVTVFPQPGNPRPRLWFKQGASLNRMGFNNEGRDAVAEHLEGQQRQGVVGVSLGKNKITPDYLAPWEHATVAERFTNLADYMVINVASPNTPGLRNLLNSEHLKDIVDAVRNSVGDNMPLFIKTTVDLALEDLDRILELCVDKDINIIDTNTTVDDETKRRHGWQGQPGGVGGSDPIFRQRANQRMRHITRETRGTNIVRFGVGAISDAPSAIERLESGAQMLQVVTAIRRSRGLAARAINRGVLKEIDRRGLSHARDMVGIAA